MTKLDDLIKKTQDKVRDYHQQVTHIKEDVTEDIDDLETRYNEMVDWLELKKNELLELIETRRDEEVDPETIAGEVDGMLEDVEDAVVNFKNEFQSEFED